MEGLLLEWANLLIRWLHLITGIAWIGASFYFVWLDNSLESPPQWKKEKGVSGDLWAFHGGGIYEVAKYQLAPPTMPAHLHWFKWEAYATWLTGTLLLIVLYYFNAELYLLGPDKWLTTAAASVLGSVLFLIGGVSVYELLIRRLAMTQEKVFVALLLVFVGLICWLACQLFSDRAAFIHVGALLGSIMVGNVFFGIIPAQRGFVHAVEAGQQPDARAMQFAKLRSVHNNYFTLPVLFCMISNHYAFVYGHSYNWLLLILIIALSAYARHFFNLRHQGVFRPQILVTSAVGLVALIVTVHWQPQPQRLDKHNASVSDEMIHDQGAPQSSELMALVESHCSNCHAANPSAAGFAAPPAGLILENVQQVQAHKLKIIPAVQSQYMPLGNLTGMTAEERTQFLALLKNS